MTTLSLRRQVQLLMVALMLLPLSLHAQTIDDLQKGVVRVTAQCEGKTRTGTGFVIRQRGGTANIVTAAHVVEGASQVDVEFFTNTGQFFRANVLGLEGGDSSGLAALVVEGDLPAHIRVLALDREMAVQAGDSVTMIGFPMKAGVPWAVTRGEVIGRRGKAVVFSGAVDEGNSGGPLIKNGAVIGVVTETTPPYARAVPAVVAQYSLESWGVKFGVQLRSRPAKLSPAEIVRMIQEKGFNHPFDLSWKGFSGGVRGAFQHEFVVIGENAVVDEATGLMWYRKSFAGIGEFIQPFNTNNVIGFSDWRVPTVEELGSLIEPLGFGNFISDLFDMNCGAHQFVTADKVVWRYVWRDRENVEHVDLPIDTVIVNFYKGMIEAGGGPNQSYCLLPVRTMNQKN